MSYLELFGARLQPLLDRAPFDEWTLPNGTLWARLYRSDSDYLIRFPNYADFEISSDGRDVRCWPVPGVSESTVEHFYLNQALPLALSRQRKLVFHAGAIEANGGALVFMGESGRGKSTLVASFARQGFRFLTDDGLQIEDTPGGYMVAPSHPSIRLWQDSHQALVTPTAQLAPPVQHTTKARILADDTLAYCDEPMPLRRVYFLGEGTARTPTIDPLNPRDALIALVAHSFLLDLDARDLLAEHFDQLARMVHLSLYYRLDYPRRYNALGEVHAAVLSQGDN